VLADPGTVYREPVEGTPFGRYQLIELLGRGGMGEVWRAHDTELDRVVALKMLLPHFTQDAEFEKRFRREARAAARLDDPHVVPIHDVGEIDGRLYVTMRLINGVDLHTVLNDGPLEAGRAVYIVEQVASALHSAHQAGLVHRDVKPSNILLAQNDFAYLIDFGIAHATGETGLTSVGSTLGTWSYMAPERFGDGEIGPGCDVYALACVLYECLTGELPFPGTTRADRGGPHGHAAAQTLRGPRHRPDGAGRRDRHRPGQETHRSLPEHRRDGRCGTARRHRPDRPTPARRNRSGADHSPSRRRASPATDEAAPWRPDRRARWRHHPDRLRRLRRHLADTGP